MNDHAYAYVERRGRPPAGPTLAVEMVRELTDQDMELLATAGPSVTAAPSVIRTIRASHHQLAQLLAQGRSHTEAALLTGYAPESVAQFRKDPTFQELMAHYGAQRELIFADVVQKMSMLGSDVVDELRAQLEENPNNFTKRELMELAELMLIKGRGGVGAAPGLAVSGAAGGVVVNVKFVSPDPGGTALTIDGKVE